MQGHTALHLAAYKGCFDVVHVLLDHGADLASKSHKVSNLSAHVLLVVRCGHGGSYWTCSLSV